MSPSSALNRDRIVSAGVALADRDGLDAVSMRRIADLLGSGTMSLYRHVAGKDDLIAAMVEAVTSRYAYPDGGGLTWREQLHLMARHDWNMYLNHPWALASVSTMAPPVGPAALRSMEWAMRALEPLGLDLPQVARAIMTVNNYLQGSARLVVAEAGRAAGDPATDPGSSWRTRLHGDDRLDEFPRVRELIEADFVTGGPDWFESGLDLILDGIEAAAGETPRR